MSTINAQIESLFSGFTVDGVSVPVSFLVYEGHGEPYVVYFQYDKDNSYSTDDEIAGYVTYFDFDVYSTVDYLAIVEAVKSTLKSAGWTWQPSRDSADMYETDTKYFHKSVCFALPVQEVEEDHGNDQEVEEDHGEDQEEQQEQNNNIGGSNNE